MFILKPKHRHLKPRRLLFSPDGRTLAVAHEYSSVRLWDLDARAEGRELHAGPLQADVIPSASAFSPDGRFLALGGVQRVVLWDLTAQRTQELPYEMRPGTALHHADAHSLAWSPDGLRLVVSVSWDIERPLRWLDPESGKEVPGLSGYPGTLAEDTAYYTDLQFTTDGLTLIGLNQAALRVWDLATGTQRYSAILHSYSQTRCLAVSPDGRLFALALGKSLTVYEASSCAVVKKIALPRKLIQDVAFGPGGRTLALVSYEEMVRIWDTTSWQERTPLVWSIGKLRCVGFALDGMRAACCNDRGVVIVWDWDE